MRHYDPFLPLYQNSMLQLWKVHVQPKHPGKKFDPACVAGYQLEVPPPDTRLAYRRYFYNCIKDAVHMSHLKEDDWKAYPMVTRTTTVIVQAHGATLHKQCGTETVNVRVQGFSS